MDYRQYHKDKQKTQDPPKETIPTTIVNHYEQTIASDGSKVRGQNVISEATVIVNNGLNVREIPSLSAPILCVINYGDKLNVLEESEEWAHVVTESKIEGYVVKQYIKIN